MTRYWRMAALISGQPYLADQLHGAIGVAPFVIVPGIDFYMGSVYHQGGQGIDDGRTGVGFVVDGYEWALFVAQDVLQFALGGLFQQLVDRIPIGRRLHFKHTVGQRRVDQRDPHRVAIQLAFQFRENLDNRGSGTGAGGNQRTATGPGPAQVLVGRIDDGLGVGQAVDRGQGTVFDAQFLVDDLHYRRQAVGGAGGRRNDAVIGRLEDVFVHAHDNILGARLFHRGGHHHPLHTLIQVALQHGNFLVHATGLDHQVATRPVGIGNGFVVSHADALAVNHHLIAIGGGFVVPAAMHAVKVQQVRQRVGVSPRVVDGHKFQLRPTPGGPQSQTANATKSVNTYLDLAHGVLLATFAIRMCDK